MTIAEKKQALLNQFSGIKNSQERFALLVSMARQQPALEPEFKTDAYRVEGCLAKLWLVPTFRDGKCYFRTDSDSAIVKSVAALLSDFYTGQPPAEILSTDPSFLETVGI